MSRLVMVRKVTQASSRGLVVRWATHNTLKSVDLGLGLGHKLVYLTSYPSNLSSKNNHPISLPSVMPHQMHSSYISPSLQRATKDERR